MAAAEFHAPPHATHIHPTPDGRATIARVYDTSPAAEAGLKSGMLLRAIDGHDVAGLGNAGVRFLLGGELESPVQLTVSGDPGQDPRHIDIIWPVWGALDFTNLGRGELRPQLVYD